MNEKETKNETNEPTNEQIREAVELGVDQAIQQIVAPYTQGAPLAIVGDVLLDRLDTFMSSDQVDRFIRNITRNTQIMCEQYEACGFTRDQAVRLMCAAITKSGA